MAAIATKVQWGSGPKIYFDFSYEKKREGSTQYYKVSLSCNPLTGTSYFGYPIYVEMYLDGTSKATHTLKNASPSQWSSALTHTTGWLGVSNKVSGKTTLKIRIYSGSGSSRESAYSYSLDIDPAASTISCTPAYIGSNPTITIHRNSSSFTHTVRYTPVGWEEGLALATIVEKTTATTITNWTIPEAFYKTIPNNRIAPIFLECITYSGNTEVGRAYCECTASTDEAKCKPTVKGSVKDINPKTIAVTSSPNVLVRYCSTALCEMDVTLNKNAGSILIKTINNTAVTGNSLEIPNVEVGTFDFYAKDSREYPNTDKVVLRILPYVKLTADVTAWRVDPTSGRARLKIEGNYFNGNFGAKWNSLSVKYRQEGGDYTYVTPTTSNANKYSVTVDLTNLDYTKAFKYEVVVEDELNAVTRSITIQKGIPVFDWGEDDFNFNVPVTIQGVDILEKLAELERLVKG